MNKRIVLELTNAYGWAYIPEVEGERLNFVRIQTCEDHDEDYDYSTEFACIMAAFIDFNDFYSILVKNFLEQDNDHDTLVIKSDLMQYVKKINTADQKKLFNDLCHAYKTIKMAGHRRPDIINYQTDHGNIDEYCVNNLWEAVAGYVNECTYEFSNFVEASE